MSNYLVIKNFHERYSFETDVEFYVNKTIQEVVEDIGEVDITEFTLEKAGVWQLDRTSRGEGNRIFPSNIIIIDITSENDYNEFYWGNTKSKFGLIDCGG